MLLYILFLVAFTASLGIRLPGKTRYQFASLARQRFSASEGQWVDSEFFNFPAIHSTAEVWRWLKKPFINNLALYGKNPITGADLLVNSTTYSPIDPYFSLNVVVGNVRLTQKRVDTSSCDFNLDLGGAYTTFAAARSGSFLLSAADHKCAGAFSLSSESKTSFGPNHTFHWSGTPSGDAVSLLFTPNPTYYYGGFGVEIPVPPNGGSADDFVARAQAQIEDLERNNFLDAQTRALMVDFTLFNPSSRLFCTARILFEFRVTGG
jgi:hypothetical protein